MASSPQSSSPDGCVNAYASGARLLPATTPKLSFVKTWHYLLKRTSQSTDSWGEVTGEEGREQPPPLRGRAGSQQNVAAPKCGTTSSKAHTN